VAKAKPDNTAKSIKAGLLSWVLPGLGHFLLGQRGLGIVCFVAISFPYLVGLALGGVKDSVSPRANKWLFLAELGVGGYTVAGYFGGTSVERYVAGNGSVDEVDFMSFYPESDVAQIYLATAGLLNILVILDAISRAQTGGLPTFHRDPRPAPKQESGP